MQNVCCKVGLISSNILSQAYTKVNVDSTSNQCYCCITELQTTPTYQHLHNIIFFYFYFFFPSKVNYFVLRVMMGVGTKIEWIVPAAWGRVQTVGNNAELLHYIRKEIQSVSDENPNLSGNNDIQRSHALVHTKHVFCSLN